MNPIKKLYCRIFQTVFRIALPVLPYRNPDILHHVKDISSVLSAKRLHKPLLVTDAPVRNLGLTKELEDILEESGHGAVVYDGTQQNPTSAMVAEAFRLYREHSCDCIIAFGGGSAMDCAKAVGACVAYPKKSLKQLAGILKVVKKTPVIFAVPTTVGTGSETTLAAVIVDEQTRPDINM